MNKDVCNHSMEITISDYWSFIYWLINKYKNEFIEHENHERYYKKDVLVIYLDSQNTLSEEEFFLLHHDLYNELEKNGFSRLYKLFKEKKANDCTK